MARWVDLDVDAGGDEDEPRLPGAASEPEDQREEGSDVDAHDVEAHGASGFNRPS